MNSIPNFLLGPTEITKSKAVTIARTRTIIRTGNSTNGIIRVSVLINRISYSYGSYQIITNELLEYPTPEGADIISPVYDIYIADSFGMELPFDGDATICFDITATEEISKKRSCLSFFNEETQEWECEDKCLERNDDDQFCGSTSHFTAFAVLFYGIDGPGANCGSAPNNYIFGVYWKDLILIACFIGLAVCCFCIFALCGKCFCFRRLVFGSEGSRVLSLRDKNSKTRTTSQI